MTNPVLEIDNLSISFATRSGDIPAVMDFSCHVMAGEAMGLVGESGCGKSTVALGIMRDLGARGRITGGSIRFKGRDMAALSPRELRAIRGREIAMVYQEPMASLNPAMRVGRQLAEVPMLHAGASRAEAEARALAMIDAVRLPDPARIAQSFPHQLSGGQQQRIVIAMALMANPALLLLDEPTTALDVTVEAGIVDLVKDLGAQMGTSLLFISHNLGLVLDVCDRLCVMYSGEAVETGPIAEVFDHMRHPYTKGLMGALPLPGTDRVSRPLTPIPGQLPLPHARPAGCNFGPRCVHLQPGLCDAAPVPMLDLPGRDRHATRCLRWREISWDTSPALTKAPMEAPLGPPVLRVEGLKKHYPGTRGAASVKAIEDISFTAHEAETLAIVGESGCGKSTLAKVLLGLETATGGTAIMAGVDLANIPVEKRSPRDLAGIQMVFQNPFDTLNPSYTVGAQIIRALEKFGIGTDDGDRHARMLTLLDEVKLPRDFATRMPRQLSGGQKQRIGIARAFAGNAQVVVADEPVSALDVSVQAAVMALLTSIQRDRRTTMLFISHDLSVVRYLADRVLVMYLGYVVEVGGTDQVFAPPYHPYTEALLSAVPIADTAVTRTRIALKGEMPSAMDPPPGCPFQTRCLHSADVPDGRCAHELPDLRDLGGGHQIRCHLPPETLRAMTQAIAVGKKV